MSKTALAIAAALIAGTMLTSAANADGVRVGFGFPLGSFVAHPNESYSSGPSRSYDRPKYAPQRRAYVADTPPARKYRPASKPTYAQIPVQAPIAAPVVKTAKLDEKLPANTDVTPAGSTTTNSPNTTTLTKTIASTEGSGADKDNDQSTATTSAAPVKTATTLPTVTVETQKVDKVAAVKADQDPVVDDGKQVCRKYSPAVGGLVDVACDK